MRSHNYYYYNWHSYYLDTVQAVHELVTGNGPGDGFGVAHVAAAGLFGHPLARRPELGRVLRRVVVEQV